MSAATLIQCDHEGCATAIEVSTDGHWWARLSVTGDGWSTEDGDFCPHHKNGYEPP